MHKNLQVPLGTCDLNGTIYDLIAQAEELEWLPPVNVPSLTHLTLQRFICTVQHLYMVTESAVLTQLQKLDITHSSGISGTLSMLMCHSFPLLDTLILNDCGLNSKVLSSLAEASVKDRLPVLKHLDVSENVDRSNHLKYLFSFSAKWQTLEILCTQQSSKPVSKNDFQMFIDKVQSGCLGSLKDLEVSADQSSYLSNCDNFKWQSLQRIHICCPFELQSKILTGIGDAVEKDILPSLQTVCFIRNCSPGLKSNTGLDDPPSFNLSERRLILRTPGIRTLLVTSAVPNCE